MIWTDAVKDYKGLPNFYVDCSSSFAYLKKDVARDLIRAYGADRVLFGTDYPMWTPASVSTYLFSLGLSASELKAICSENAKNLFDIR